MSLTMGRLDLIPVVAGVLLAVVALFLITGCGGGNSTASTSAVSEAPTITKEQLIKQGDAICRKTDEAQIKSVAAFEKKNGEPKNPQEMVAMLAKVAPSPLQGEIRELAALGAPESEKVQVNAIIQGLEKALKATEADPSALLSFGEGYFRKPGELAKAFGFNDCAEPL